MICKHRIEVQCLNRFFELEKVHNAVESRER